MSISRRKMLKTTFLGSLAISTGACVTTRVGTVTTVVIDVKKVKLYTTAGLNAAAAINAALAFVPAYTAISAVTTPIIALLNSDLQKFLTAVGDSATLTFDSNSPSSEVISILSDLDRLLVSASDVASTKTATTLGVSATTSNTLTLIHEALSTIITIFRSMLGLPISTSGNGGGMTEHQALVYLGL